MPRPNHRDPEIDLAAALGEELRRLRLKGGFAVQEAFAKAIVYGREQVSKIETGAELPSKELFEKWLEVCKAGEEDRYYLRRSLSQARRAKAGTPAFAKPWRAAERLAEFLLLWAPVLVPGLLQVREYAIAVFIAAGRTEEEAIAMADDRLARQAILTGDAPVHVTAVLHESVLDREVGSPETMILQLEGQLTASQARNIIIQVVRGDKYFLGMEAPFEIATGVEIPDTLVMVSPVEDQNSQDRILARTGTKLFKDIQSRALNVDDSRILIQEALQRWKDKLKQQ